MICACSAPKRYWLFFGASLVIYFFHGLSEQVAGIITDSSKTTYLIMWWGMFLIGWIHWYPHFNEQIDSPTSILTRGGHSDSSLYTMRVHKTKRRKLECSFFFFFWIGRNVQVSRFKGVKNSKNWKRYLRHFFNVNFLW